MSMEQFLNALIDRQEAEQEENEDEITIFLTEEEEARDYWDYH